MYKILDFTITRIGYSADLALDPKMRVISRSSVYMLRAMCRRRAFYRMPGHSIECPSSLGILYNARNKSRAFCIMPGHSIEYPDISGHSVQCP